MRQIPRTKRIAIALALAIGLILLSVDFKHLSQPNPLVTNLEPEVVEEFTPGEDLAMTEAQAMIAGLAADRFAVVKMLGDQGGFQPLYEGANLWADQGNVWRTIPPYLDNMVFWKYANRKSGTANFVIEQPGIVVLAATTRWGRPVSGDRQWVATAATQKSLLADGWHELGQIADSSAVTDWLVFWRNCRAGETFGLRTEKYCAPIVMLRNNDHVVLSGKAIKIEPNNVPPNSGVIGPSLSVNGLAGKNFLKPIEFPSRWQSKEAFATITSPGRIVFPTLSVSSCVLEMELTVRNPAGKLTLHLGDQDYATALVIGHMWNHVDKDVKQVRCRLFSCQPFGVNWAGAHDCEPGKRLQLKIVVPDAQKRWLYVNGLPALCADGVAADLTLEIRAETNTDATIHTLALRMLEEEDAWRLGMEMPQHRMSVDVDAAAARLHRESVGLRQVPQAGSAFVASSTGTVMQWIEPGEFVMGTPRAVYAQFGKGAQRVRFSRGFWIGQHKVTQAEWAQLMGNNPSRLLGSPYLPVNWISWADAVRFCRKLTEAERRRGGVPAGYEYRVPTEAEWEYACSAGGKDASVPDGSTEPIWRRNLGQESPNSWGVCGMLGSVPEWCADAWRPYPADGGSNVVRDRFEPGGLDVDRFVVRGGPSSDQFTRFRATPTVAGDYRGFRIVLGRALKLWSGEFSEQAASNVNLGVTPAKNVAFVTGPSYFQPGDKIVINEVRSKLGTLSEGDTVTVKGTYTLASRSNANLSFYITQSSGDPTDLHPGAHLSVAAESGPFELTRAVTCKGYLHIGFYDTQGFGTVYFGTYAQMQEIAGWDLRR